MKCYFLRHGVAVEPERWNGTDAERPLTDEGVERMRREAKRLAALALDIDAIVTSPLVRARGTAEIVADAFGARGKLVEDARLGFGFDLKTLGAILREHARAGAILLVGHEPSMSSTIGALLGGARVAFKKGGVACVSITSPSVPAGELEWLAHPKLLLLR
jgi:phosphohistidine phosphatase